MFNLGMLWIRVKDLFWGERPVNRHAARWRAHKMAAQKEKENLVEGLMRLSATKKAPREMRVLVAPRMVKAKDLLKEKKFNE